MKRFEHAVSYACGGAILLGVVVPLICQWGSVQPILDQTTKGQLSIDRSLMVLLTTYCSINGASAGAVLGAANGWLKPIIGQ